MVTKCATSMSRAAIASSNAAVEYCGTHRISTKTLENTFYAVNTVMGAIACWYHPEAALTGAVAAALIRRVTGDTPRSEITEQERRQNRIALMCCTTLATVFTGTAHMHGITTIGTYFAPLFVGFEASTNGIYPILRDLIS